MREYDQSPKGKASQSFRSIKKRIGKGSYKDVELRLTQEQYMYWAVPAYEHFMRKNPGVTPSVDRIDNGGHYERGNLQVISYQDNASKRSNTKRHLAPEGHSWCRICDKFKPYIDFGVQRSSKNGCRSECFECMGMPGNGRGIRSPRAKLTEADVSQIKELHQNGATTKFLADKFCVTTAAIRYRLR